MLQVESLFCARDEIILIKQTVQAALEHIKGVYRRLRLDTALQWSIVRSARQRSSLAGLPFRCKVTDALIDDLVLCDNFEL